MRLPNDKAHAIPGLYDYMANPKSGTSPLPSHYHTSIDSQHGRPVFYSLSHTAFDSSQHYTKGDGWKIHISVAPEDLSRAWDRVVGPALVESQVGAAKIATPEVAAAFADPSGPQAGKMITIYGAGKESWAEIAKKIEIGLTQEGIRPGPSEIGGDRMIKGSRYIGYRNERSFELSHHLKGKSSYIASEDIRQLVRQGIVEPGWEHNPTQRPDTLQNIDFSKDPAVQAARSNFHPPARAMPRAGVTPSVPLDIDLTMHRIDVLQSVKGPVAVIRSEQPERLQVIQGHLKHRGIDTLLVTDEDGYDGKGLRVRAASMEQFNTLMRDHPSLADTSPAHAMYTSLTKTFGANNIKHVYPAPAQDGYYVAVDTYFSRQNLSKIGINPADIVRAGNSDHAHMLIIPEAAIPQEIINRPVNQPANQPANRAISQRAVTAGANNGVGIGLGAYALYNKFASDSSDYHRDLQSGDSKRVMAAHASVGLDSALIGTSTVATASDIAAIRAARSGIAANAGKETLHLAGKIGTRAMIPLAVTAGGVQTYAAIHEGDRERAAGAIGTTTGGILGGLLAGAGAGALIGGTGGSVVPGAGTVIGGVVVGLVGAIGGAIAGEEAAKRYAAGVVGRITGIDEKLITAMQELPTELRLFLERDMDGRVHVDEVHAFLKKVNKDSLDKLDLNRDKIVSGAELAQTLRAAVLTEKVPELQAKGWGNVLGDNDGTLTAQEVISALQGVSLLSLDRNRNGDISGREITDALNMQRTKPARER